MVLKNVTDFSSDAELFQWQRAYGKGVQRIRGGDRMEAPVSDQWRIRVFVVFPIHRRLIAA